MAETEVLFNEPRHKIDEFVDEIKERRAAVEQVLREPLEQLCYTLLEQFVRRIATGSLRHISFGTPRWTLDGRLVIDTVQRDVAHGPRPVAQVVSEFREKLDALRQGVIDQVAMVRKHALLFDPRQLRFGAPRWHLDGTVMVDLYYRGRPFQPNHDIRWY